MSGSPGRFWVQPVTGTVTVLVGLAALGVSAFTAGVPSAGFGWDGNFILAGLLMAGVYLAYRFPIHLRHGTKMEMASLPLYLAAVLLPPVLAALVAGAGTAGGELSVRKARGLYYSDIASQVGRRIPVALLVSALVHLPAATLPRHTFFFVAAAVVYFAGEIVTAPFVLTPTTGERPWRVILEVLKEAGVPEGLQYFLGLMGAMIALASPWALFLLLVPIALLYRASKRARELQENARSFLVQLADQTDARDPFTQEHSKRVTRWVADTLAELTVLGMEAQVVTTAARLHDIGKVAVPDAILAKTDLLTRGEQALLQEHARTGADMLRSYEIPAFSRGAEIVLAHHERWDGAGYPRGLAGTDIPFGARVIAVADSFDAMTSDRPYRAGMPVERALAILREGSGTQWDPAIVASFLRVVERATAQTQMKHHEPVGRRTTVQIAPAS